MPPYRDRRTGRWRYRKVFRLGDGSRFEVSGTPKTNTKLAARQEEDRRVADALAADAVGEVLVPGGAKERVPTLRLFKEEFMETYVKANNKPSERLSKESVFKHHLLPAFGNKRLDEITTRDVERFKAEKLEQLRPKSVNNLLTCLGKTLRYAAENEIIEKIPRIRFVKTMAPEIDFLDFEEWDRLVAAASHEAETFPAILLAGDAGLRVGEIRALQWGDLDLGAGRRVTVQRTDYRGYEGSPKDGRLRVVPMTSRLLNALKAARHLKSEYVFAQVNGIRWSPGQADTPLRRAFRRAKLRKVGWHALRHTFCSHLAMRGAPVRTIQELAGHASITTTMRYMHLTPNAKIEAIRLLEQPTSSQHRLNED